MQRSDIQNFGVKLTLQGVGAYILILGFLLSTFLLNTGSVHVLPNLIRQSALNLSIFSLVLLPASYKFGRVIVNDILKKKIHFTWIGIRTAFLILLTAITSAAAISYIFSTEEVLFVQYIFRPVIVFLIYGTVPTIILGVWLGYQLNKIVN